MRGLALCVSISVLDESGYHGSDGPQFVEDAMETLEVKFAFIRASQELGLEAVDSNARDTLGTLLKFRGWR